MKKYLYAVAFTLISTVLIAQQPTVTVRVQWDANPSSDLVTGYTLTIDTLAPITVPVSNCVLTVCTQSATVPYGSHTFTVTATNDWGTSLPTTVTKTIAPPFPPTNLRIIK
jgi:hypothetical protein